MKYNIFNPIISWVIKKRIHRINKFIKEPIKSQDEVLKNLILQSKDTIWGRKYNYTKINNYTDFQKKVPIQSYEDIKPYVELIKSGSKNPSIIFWDGDDDAEPNGLSGRAPLVVKRDGGDNFPCIFK